MCGFYCTSEKPIIKQTLEKQDIGLHGGWAK